MKTIKVIGIAAVLLSAMIFSLFIGIERIDAAQSPSVTTQSASGIDRSSATLNGYFDSHGNYSYGWFEWGTTSSFGNSTGKTGSSVSTTMARSLTGLSADTTYYFRAVAENDHGKEYGQIRSFTTAGTPVSTGQSPSVTTQSASGIDRSSATLNGYFDSHGNYSYGWFEWGKTSSLGNSTTKTGSSISTTIARSISGLSDDTTYYFRTVAENDHGKQYGQIRSFTTAGTPVSTGQSPSVTTQSASGIDRSSATLNGYFDSHGNYTYNWFEWGTTSSLTNTTSKVGGSISTTMARSLTGLSADTTYYFRAVAENDYGREYGQVRSFTTTANPAPTPGQSPSVTTQSASGIDRSSATLNGYFDSHGNYSYGWFEWGKSSSLGDSTGKTGSSVSTTMARSLTGLSADTTYYFRAVAENDYGREYGQIRSFTTGKDSTVYGDIYCDFTTHNSITLRYNFTNGENVSLFREGSRINNWSGSSSSGTFNDSGLSPNTSYKYYLRNGSSTGSAVIDSVTCRTDGVYTGYEDLTIRNLVRINDGDQWSESITVSPSSRISVRIEIRPTGDEDLNNVIVRNILPDNIEYIGNLRVDGSSVSGNIDSGLNIGRISIGGMKVVTFDAQVKGSDAFGIGSTNLTNSAFASAGNKNVNDTARISVVKGIVAGAATNIKTGVTDNKLIDFILLPLLATTLIFFLFRGQFQALANWFDEKKEDVDEKRSKKKLEEMRELALLREKLN